MELAHKKNCSIKDALKLREDQFDLGCDSDRGLWWERKVESLYMSKAKLIFTNIFHWNLVSDPGTHAYKDCMPSVCYSHEIDQACLPQYQELAPGKALIPGCDADLLDGLVSLAEEQKLERVSAYRQLQGHNVDVNGCICSDAVGCRWFGV